jgi:lysozyme
VVAGFAALCVVCSSAPQVEAHSTAAHVSAPLVAGLPTGQASSTGKASDWVGSIRTTTTSPTNSSTCSPITGRWNAALDLTVDAQGAVHGIQTGATDASCPGGPITHTPYSNPVTGQLTAHEFRLDLAWPVAGVMPTLIVPLTSPNAAHVRLAGTISIGTGTAWTTTVTLTRTLANVAPPKKRKTPKKKTPKKMPCPKPKVGLNKSLRPTAETLEQVKKQELPGGKLTAKFACGWRAGRCSGNELYDDPSGYCTIGWGHLLVESECTGNETAEIDGETIALKNGVTPQQAQALFESDVAGKVKLIDETINVPLTQGQFDALVDFAYNEGGYVNSMLRTDINCEKYGDAPTQFNRWIYAKNKEGEKVVSTDLEERRTWEIEEWLQ